MALMGLAVSAALTAPARTRSGIRSFWRKQQNQVKDMTEQARIYGTVLFELGIPGGMIEKAAKMLAGCPELVGCLTSPVIPAGKKRSVIRKVFREPDFSGRMICFLEKACESGCIDEMEAIIQVWREKTMAAEGILPASLEYVTRPDEEQLAAMRKFLCRRTGRRSVEFSLKENPELLAGFVLRAGDMEYDYSLKGQLAQLTRAVAG